jgi:hypothetical protein
MSYTIDLVRLPANVDAEAAYRERAKEKEEELAKSPGADPGPGDPQKEQAKQELAQSLVTRHPSLRMAQPDFEALGRRHRIDVSEAKRRFRNIELNDEQHSIQIVLFDDTAGASFSFSGAFEECKEAMNVLWGCLKILHSQGGFSAFDPQVGKVLNLDSDFDRVVKTACGRRA